MEDYSQDTIQQREIHSVTEINQTASDFLNEAFPPVWVAGEISNFREYGTSGHWYFSIKDSSSVLSCTMFRLQNSNLRFKPKEGDQVILNPDEWSKDQTLNLANVSLSPDEKYLAYSVSDGGVDWRTIYLINLQTMEKLEAAVTEVKFSSIDWDQDSKGFYYNKYPKPEEKNRLCEPSLNAAIYYFDINSGENSLFYGEVNPEENYSLSFVGDDDIPLIRVINGSE